MLTTEEINKLIGVEESFHASYKLMKILECEADKNNLFDEFLKVETDLSYDWFLNYYQSEHSDRKGKMQDFTPNEVAEIASSMAGDSKSTLDMCSGVGGLTIKRWVDNPNQEFYCEEFSDRAIPFLLFNLAIRNIEGIVRHGDSLTRQFKTIYRLSEGERFSNIEKIPEDIEIKAETVIMNPPYSFKWEHRREYLEERRFKHFERLAPKSKADYAFLLTGLDQLDDNGKMVIILPHGVLFRGGAEGHIRRKLVEKNLIESIIGLPEKVFYNTDIPTVIMVLRRNKKDKETLFIDASEEFENVRPKNRLRNKDIKKILETYEGNKEIERYSKVIRLEEIEENDYNLNIPRYIDKYVEEYIPPLTDILKEMIKIDEQIELTHLEFTKMVRQLRDVEPEGNKELRNFARYLNSRQAKKKRGQISFYD